MIIQSVYSWFLRNGENCSPSMGSASNAFLMARDTGNLPRWAVPGTACYSAAKAGIDTRTHNQACKMDWTGDEE